MNSMKFRVRDRAHSVEIQKALFEQGYTWCSGGTEVLYTGSKFLYADSVAKTIACGDVEVFFNADEFKEYEVFNGAIWHGIGPVPEPVNLGPESYIPVPPVGLRPRKLVVEERMLEVLEAMQRYVKAGKMVPDEWVDELLELRGKLKYL